MSLNNFIISTLTPLNIPVSLSKSTSPNYPNATFFEYLAQGEFFADDGEVSTGHYIQIDIWSKTDYTILADQALDLLKNAGFARINEQDLYESDTQIYHKAIRVFYSEEI